MIGNPEFFSFLDEQGERLLLILTQGADGALTLWELRMETTKLSLYNQERKLQMVPMDDEINLSVVTRTSKGLLLTHQFPCGGRSEHGA